MKMQLVAALLILSVSGLGAASAAEEVPVRATSVPSLPPETVRSDFSLLYQTLQEAHFDLYAHRQKDDYDG